MKPYIKPLITEVKLEDQEVASMSNSCKQAPEPGGSPIGACADENTTFPTRSWGS